MNKIITLDLSYSTTTRVAEVEPEFIADLIKQAPKPEDHFDTQVFLPASKDRQGEGGLRTKNYFKVGGLISEASIIAESNSVVPVKTEITSQQKPLITVVTVVYNGEKFLEETILSVINQSYDNVEYIIIDGGSTDGTLDIIKKYEHAIDYWISEKDKGIYDAMNKGISLSLGSLIGLINADDWYENDTFQKISKNYNRNSLIYGKLKSYLIDGRTLIHDISVPKKREEVKISTVHPTVFLSHDLYKRVGLFDTRYKITSDYDLMIRMYLANANIIKVDKVFANFREGGISSNGAGLKEGFQIAKKHEFRKSALLRKYLLDFFYSIKQKLKKFKVFRILIKQIAK